MGNYISCTFASPITIKTPKAARVILPGGEIRQYREPVKAADLMLEWPSFFLVNARSLNIGRRFSSLAADEDLEFGNVYVMFQMKRVSSVATAADLAVIFMATNTAAKRITGGNVRVSPESGEAPNTEARSPRLNLEVQEAFPAPEFNQRLGLCRSRKPALDTIKEETICPKWKLILVSKGIRGN